MSLGATPLEPKLVEKSMVTWPLWATFGIYAAAVIYLTVRKLIEIGS